MSYLQSPLCWPVKLPGSDLDYSYDTSADMAGLNDTILSVTASCSPYGQGELTIAYVNFATPLITLWLTGGVAGRIYTIEVLFTTSSGRVFELDIRVEMDRLFATWPVPAVTNAGFGPPISWMAGTPVIPPSMALVATGLVSGGTNQATAVPLAAFYNVATSGIGGGGFVLPTLANPGTIAFTNTWTQDILIYPPGAAVIGTGSAGGPVVVSAGSGEVHFTTTAASTQWYSS